MIGICEVPSYEWEFRRIGRIAKYFKGGMSIPEMMKMDFRRDIKPWWDRMERQIAEEIIIRELTEKDKPIPDGVAMEKRIDKKIKDWYKEVD